MCRLLSQFVLLIHNKSHHVSWNLLHLGRWSSRSRVELVDEEAGEAVLPHELHRLLKVLLRLSWETTDDVCGNSDAWNPTGDTQETV